MCQFTYWVQYAILESQQGNKRKQLRHRQSLKPNTEITDKGGTV
uniref:Uncharacterized protein n=1 Tax=Siphoviridae sp. ctOba29 TaxID=2825480 RepID=A0A8S5NW00_9CAUD|nr:MAG TPA: hypothetical protein [Siphoviridae sp. ctOba29]